MPLTHTVINKLLLSTPRLIQSDLTSIVTVTGCNYGCITLALSHGSAHTVGKISSKPSLLVIIEI